MVSTRFSTVVCTASLFLMACAGDSGPAGFYGIDLRTTPGALAPGAQATFVLTLQSNGAPELGATVSATMTNEEGASITIGDFSDRTDGTYEAGPVEVSAGTWDVAVSLSGSLGKTSATFEVLVSCDNVSDGAPGTACCAATDCTSAVCEAAICSSPACDDGVVNGTEADIDCGGECALCDLGAVCSSGGDCLTGNCLSGVCAPRVPALGGGDIGNVSLTAIAVGVDGLASPRDLAFEPGTSHLWVVNQASDSVTILFNAGSDQQTTQNYWGPGSVHFCPKPSALAFGAPGTMATIHETDVPTQGPGGTPGDFMGPTLQSTNLSIFDAGEMSHLDMLHNTPNGMGIAWEDANIYWVFDGYHSSITRYDFRLDHGPAGTDHTDGIIHRYVEGQVKRVPNVPSHMEMDRATKLLYIADTGNNRIAVLDTKTGSRGQSMPFFENYDGISDQSLWNSAPLATLVDGAAVGLQAPSGLALLDDIILVGDNATGLIWAFDKLSGEVIDKLDTGLGAGSVTGLEYRNGAIYFTDVSGNRVMRLQAK